MTHMLVFAAGQRPHAVCPREWEDQIPHTEVPIPSPLYQRAGADEPVVQTLEADQLGLTDVNMPCGLWQPCMPHGCMDTELQDSAPSLS